MINKLYNYLKIETSVLVLIKSQFFLQLIATSFFLILNIYLSKNSFSDSEIADLISYRFLAVIILSYPFGYFISFRKLKPFLVVSCILLPVVAILLVLMIQYELNQYLKIIFFTWGILFTMFQISVLPYIMRYTSNENQTYAISLSFATHSISMLIAGIIIYILSNLLNIDEGQILLIISSFGFLSFYYLKK